MFFLSFSRLGVLPFGVLVLVGGFFAQDAQATLQIIDQQNPGSPSLFVTSAGGVGSGLGQSFTPATVSMNAADFYIQPYSPLTLVLDVRSGTGFSGTLLASSEPISLTSTLGQSVEFLFTSPVTLVPEAIYSFRVRISAGGSSGYLIAERTNSYFRGTELSNDGSGNGGFDLIFAEGIAAVPEPSAKILLGFGILLTVGALLRRNPLGSLRKSLE